ncbi:MAG: hypothetical protein ACOC2N_07895 [Spirochaetota bacterium]
MPEDTEVRRTIHDLNNALTRILTTAELIVEQADDETQIARDARDIRSAALEGRDLVTALATRVLH